MSQRPPSPTRSLRSAIILRNAAATARTASTSASAVLTRTAAVAVFTQLSSATAVQCSSYFVDPDWLTSGAFTDNEGRLKCPHCGCKLGSFVWSGDQCSCGEWIVPSFRFSKCKVDEKRIAPPLPAADAARGGARVDVGAPFIRFNPRLEAGPAAVAEQDTDDEKKVLTAAPQQVNLGPHSSQEPSAAAAAANTAYT